MAKANPNAERAAKFAETLRQAREQNDYPLTAARLRELADPAANDDELFKALTHESLAVAARKDLTAPVALAEDAERFAASDALLEYALGKLATAEKPLHPVAKVVGKVEKSLQPAFEAALNTRLSDNNLPASVKRQDVKETPHLYLAQFPPPPPKKNPAVELAEQLVAGLGARGQQGQTVCAVSELCPADTPPALLKKALSEEAFTSKAVSLPLTKTLTLAAPSGDRDALLGSDRVLTELLESRTTAKKPFTTADDLAAALPEEYRAAFAAVLDERIQNKRLPAGVVLREHQNPPGLCLEKNLPATLLLGEKVLDGLRRRRGTGDYPVRLDALLKADAPDARPELVEQLVNDRPFRSQVLFAFPGRTDSPVALPGDEEALAASRLVLESAVGLLSTAQEPLHPLKKVSGKLDAALRPAFEQAVTKHLADNTLPASLAAHDLKGQAHLRRAEHPLPPPADEALANKLLAALKESRAKGTYPVTVRELLTQAAPQATEKQARAALAHAAFRDNALVSVPNDLDAPAALADDRGRLASDPRLLNHALTRARAEDNTAFLLADLSRRLAPDLQGEFTTAVEKQLASGSLPATVGCLVIKKKPFLFLRSDLAAKPIVITSAKREELPDEVPVRDNFDAEMSQLHKGRPEEPKAAAPKEQGDLFAPVGGED